jgi:hypothetical protein
MVSVVVVNSLLLTLLVSLLSVSTEGAVVQISPVAYKRYASHPLHDLLAIGDDPNQDIRANILLNMEGI